ncbi:MAG: lipopolysaccharide biosynthesis protein RfbH [Turneriella sp.]|nr:lipopolysaccharide biosynthesis protein RfbH [Turneriella sp.]
MNESIIGQIYESHDSDAGSILIVISNANKAGRVQALPARTMANQVDKGDFIITPADTIESEIKGSLILSPSEITTIDSSGLGARKGQLSPAILSELLKAVSFLHTEAYYTAIHAPAQKAAFVAGKTRVNYAGRIFDQNEMINLVDSSLDFWLTTGRYAEQFEEEFAHFIGVKKALLVNSGSSANLVAFSALTSPLLKERQIKKGDEVIGVAAGFPTTINPILQYGAVPVFVDIELDTHNIDVSRLEEALSPRTKAVMLAHTLGNPFDLEAVKAFCDKHNLWLIEDNCDALGSKYLYKGEWSYTGSIGDIGTSSFYPPHHMTMGEGGAVYTNNPKLRKIAESFRDWGRDCWCASGKDDTCGKRFNWQLGELPMGYDHKYVYSHFGYNLKVTDMQAAIGVAQLKKLPEFIQARRRNWQMLRDGLAGLEEFLVLPAATKNSEPSWFGFILTVRDSSPVKRNDIVSHLEKNNVQTRMLFAGNYLRHPAFDQIRGSDAYRVIGDLPNTDKAMNNSFWLGVYPGMTEEMIAHVCQTIKVFCQEKYRAII